MITYTREHYYVKNEEKVFVFFSQNIHCWVKLRHTFLDHHHAFNMVLVWNAKILSFCKRCS